MRVRLWQKSTRISVATCQKERIERRYFSLHWGAGAMPRKETWHGHEERSASCNITIKAFPTPRALKKSPLQKTTQPSQRKLQQYIKALPTPRALTKRPYKKSCITP